MPVEYRESTSSRSETMNTISRWQPEIAQRDGPKYLAVLETLARDIRNGTLRPGDRLPPQRRIAEHFGVTISTITKVFAEASRRGLVEATPGSGTFIASASPVTPAPGGTLVDMSINLIPHALCQDHLCAGLRDYVETTPATDMLGYAGYRLCPGTPGHHFALWLMDRFCLAAEGVLLTCNGTQQGLVAAMQCLSTRGDTILCEAQTYTGILRIARHQGLIAHGVGMDGEGVCPDELERGLVDTGARLVVLAPTAQNPTGATMSSDRRRVIAELLRKHDAFLIEDAVAAPLARVSVPSVASHASENCIYLTGASKCVAPGVRFGIMRVPERLAGPMNEILVASNWMGPAYFAGFADLLVKSGRMDKILPIYQSDAIARQELARRYLGGGAADTAIAYHVWHHLPPLAPAQSIVAEAAAVNVHLAGAAPFSCPNVIPPNALRLCLGAEPDIRTLETGLDRLARLLKKPRPLSAPVI